MFRVNYRPPEEMPSHHRDFPTSATSKDVARSADGSGQLVLLVTGYLLALIFGVAVLGALTAPDVHRPPQASAVAGG